VILYHAAPAARAIAIMLRGFHDGRDAAAAFAHGIVFEADPTRSDDTFGVALTVDDHEAIRRFAVSLWPGRRSRSGRNFCYVLPADVANCYAPRMIGDVSTAA
jgi:hypothetical protein